MRPELIIFATTPPRFARRGDKLETVQRKITKTILKDYESTYEERFLKKCGLEQLEERWKNGMKLFANEQVKSSKFSDEFCPRNKINAALRWRRAFKTRKARTKFLERRTLSMFISRYLMN